MYKSWGVLFKLNDYSYLYSLEIQIQTKTFPVVLQNEYRQLSRVSAKGVIVFSTRDSSYSHWWEAAAAAAVAVAVDWVAPFETLTFLLRRLRETASGYLMTVASAVRIEDFYYY